MCRAFVEEFKWPNYVWIFAGFAMNVNNLKWLFSHEFSSVIGVTLWGVLRLSGESIGSKVVLSVGYLLVVMLIILFLFIPKLSAPIRRRICKHVTSKSSSIDHQTTLSTQIQEKELSTLHVT